MDKLHLKVNKVRILKYFLARFPYMLDKTCTCDIIIQRSIDVGMLDAKHKFWTDFYAILKTKRRCITRYEMKVIQKHFSRLFTIMLEMGHIPENVYDDIVFPKDGVSGVVYDLNDGIERDWMQQETLLAHWSQKHLRLARQNKIENKMVKKEQDKQKSINDVIQLNEEADIKLLL